MAVMTSDDVQGRVLFLSSAGRDGESIKIAEVRGGSG